MLSHTSYLHCKRAQSASLRKERCDNHSFTLCMWYPNVTNLTSGLSVLIKTIGSWFLKNCMIAFRVPSVYVSLFPQTMLKNSLGRVEEETILELLLPKLSPPWVFPYFTANMQNQWSHGYIYKTSFLECSSWINVLRWAVKLQFFLCI